MNELESYDIFPKYSIPTGRNMRQVDSAVPLFQVRRALCQNGISAPRLEIPKKISEKMEPNGTPFRISIRQGESNRMEAQWNDPAALAQRFAPAVYRLAFARTGSRTDAEDVMQEVFLRLVKSRPAFDSEAHAKAWLLRVASNCANDLFRLPWRKREEPLDEDISAPEAPQEGSVTLAVLALPARYRIPIHLYYYEGYSVAEIAKIINKSEGTVKSRLSRARALLKTQLKEGDPS